MLLSKRKLHANDVESGIRLFGSVAKHSEMLALPCFVTYKEYGVINLTPYGHFRMMMDRRTTVWMPKKCRKPR